MKKAGILVAVGMVALFFVACGGGGGTTPSGGQTPGPASKTPTPVAAVGELVKVTGTTEFMLEPSIIELKLGKSYQFQLLNRGNNSYRLRVPRWDVMLFAQAGNDSEVSKVFTPDAAGVFDCFEEFNAARHDMRCSIKVSP
ncbi:MAG: hypothetical protein EXR53_03665 [Dehalococcoidia bacterium]|nr:hypothetical protein [Dehalococcoidia bacterium]